MSEHPRKSSSGFWTTVLLLGLFVGYPLSIGPVALMFEKCFESGLTDDSKVMMDRARSVYCFPLQMVYDHSPEPVQNVMGWYVNLWIAD